MTPGTDQDNAADALVSNFFISRKTGRVSRGFILVHVSNNQVDYTIPPTVNFNFNSSLQFVSDYDGQQIVVPQADIINVADSTGAITDSYFILNVVSTAVGDQYDVAPGTWLGSDKFSPFITKIESTAQFVGGLSTETTAQLLARAPDAIAVRDLNSERSITTVLLDTFTNIDEVIVVGAGDPEMQRDVVYPVIGLPGVHVGGATDAYIHCPVVSQTFEALLGGTFTDPRPAITLFSDSSVSNFVTAGVLAGQILQIYNALTLEPTLFVITAVSPEFITVSAKNPFPALRTGVLYSVGSVPDLSGNWNNIIFSSSTGQYTNSFSISHQILLPEVPIYDITGVSYLDGSGNRIYLTRSNAAPVSSSGNYQLYYGDSSWANTGYQLAYLSIDPAISDSTNIRVQFDTPSGFADVQAYMADPFNRIACASVFPRGLNSVYVGGTINYTLSPTATSDIPSTANQTLANFINTYSPNATLSVSNIINFLMSTFPQIGDIVPFSLMYNLYSPDGRVIPYVTANSVVVEPSKETSVPPLLPNPIAFGISTRTLEILSSPSLFTLTNVSGQSSFF